MNVHSQMAAFMASVTKYVSQPKPVYGLHLGVYKGGVEKVSGGDKGDGPSLIKTFLISDKQNSNEWSVSWESIKKYAKDFIGFPGIYYIKCDDKECDLDHTGGESYAEAINEQNQYKVTEVVDVTFDEATHTAYAVQKITDPNFEKIMDKVPVGFVSPAIIPDEDTTLTTITDDYSVQHHAVKWSPLHIAYVNKPAFGDEAKVVHQCAGKDCYQQIMQARHLGINDVEKSKFLVKNDGQVVLKASSTKAKSVLNGYKLDINSKFVVKKCPPCEMKARKTLMARMNSNELGTE